MKRLYLLIPLLIQIILLVIPVFSVNIIPRTEYNFHVHYEYTHVYINKDGSVTIEYEIALVNHISEGIDYIDIGMPNPWYRIEGYAEWSPDNGTTWYNLSTEPSEVLDCGIQVYIPFDKRIGKGQEGIIRVKAVVDKMVFHDREKLGYAGVEFSPTWFSSEYCTIVENMTTWIHFPEGMINESEAYYHHKPPTATYVEGNSLVFAWTEVNITPQQIFYGVSFPEHYVNRVYDEFWDYSLPLFLDEWGPFLAIIGLCLGTCVAIFLIGRYRARHYLKPLIEVEGLGINRGLTVAEAAVVLELPLERIVTVIMYGLLRKGKIKIEHKRPVRIIPLVDKNDPGLRYYERKFLECVRRDGTLSESKLKRFLYGFIKTVASKMRGYSLSRTKAYYKSIIKRAMEEMKNADTPEKQIKAFEEYMEWLLLDEKPEQRFSELKAYHRSYYVPNWYVSFARPHISSGTTRGTSSSSSKGDQGISISLPQLANSMVYSLQTFTNNLAVNFSNISNYIVGRVYPSSSGGFSGGGGCACASCACACAGGGR